jgi:hypothetical protein
MAEIVDDLKISNVEITSELGINFTNDITRIKHTGNDEFNISSSGEINIRTEKKSNGNDCDISLYTGDGQEEGGSKEGGDIRFICGNGAGNNGTGGDIIINAGDGVTGIGGGRGGYINIYAGDGGDDEAGNINIHAGDGVIGNADGGYLEIYAGDSRGEAGNGGYIEISAGDDDTNGTTGLGGYINIDAGYSDNGVGGDINIRSGDGDIMAGNILIECGDKDGNNENSGASVTIRGGYSNGITGKGGNVELYGGYGITGYGDIILGGSGDIIISEGPEQKIGFFGNTPVIRPAETGITGAWSQNGGSEVRNESSFTGDIGNKAYTIGDIVRALKQLGLLDSFNAAPGVAPASMAAPQPRAERPVKVRKDKSKKEKDN